MLSFKSLAVFTSLLISFAAAQNTTNFDPTAVDLPTKSGWCNGELANCPLLCGGLSQVKQNDCLGQTLVYHCVCANGSAPSNLDQYQGTLPNFICEATFMQCRQQNPGSNACKNCGTLQPTDVAAIATTSSEASSASATATSASASAATPSHSGAASNVKAVGGTGLVGGLLAALLL